MILYMCLKYEIEYLNLHVLSIKELTFAIYTGIKRSLSGIESRIEDFF